MATTFATLYAAALRSAQASSSDSTALAAAKAAVNEAYLSVCGDGTPWDFLERTGQWSTTSGTATYTYSTIATGMSLSGGTIKEVVYLVDDTAGGRPIRSMSWGQLEGLSGSTELLDAEGFTGPPEAWAKYGTGSVKLFPTPGGAYDLSAFVYLNPTALSADGDTVLLPDSFAMAVLVPYAASILLEEEGGGEALQAANRLISRYQENHRRMLVAHGSAKRPTFNVVAPAAFADLDEFDWWHAV